MNGGSENATHDRDSQNRLLAFRHGDLPAFEAQLKAWQSRMERALDKRLPPPEEVPQRLHQAMRYSVLGGGKRIPFAMPIVDACRAISLSQAVDMGDVEARFHHAGQDGFRRRRGGRDEFHAPGNIPSLV